MRALFLFNKSLILFCFFTTCSLYAETNNHYQLPPGVHHGYWHYHPGYLEHDSWYPNNKYCNKRCYFDPTGKRLKCVKHCLDIPNPPTPLSADVGEGD